MGPSRAAVVSVLVAGNVPGGGGVASPDGSVVGSQNNTGLNGGYGSTRGYDGIELKTSVQFSSK